MRADIEEYLGKVIKIKDKHTGVELVGMAYRDIEWVGMRATEVIKFATIFGVV